MAKKKNTNPKGFTIIEVVLVLAIAGLIFLMVFIALPALQRSQRDTQRRSDFSRFISQLENYQANNRNALPTTTAETVTGQLNVDKDKITSTKGWAAFYKNYLLASTDDFADPDGKPYNLNVKTTVDQASSNEVFNTSFSHNIYVYINATCSGETVVASTGNRKIAMTYKLEGGGVACYNN